MKAHYSKEETNIPHASYHHRYDIEACGLHDYTDYIFDKVSGSREPKFTFVLPLAFSKKLSW
jgi:hypothetical protein